MTSTRPSQNANSKVQVEERQLRVLHVAECYEAGVGHAVDTIVRILEKDTHILLYSGDKIPITRFDETLKLRGSFAKRIMDVRNAVRVYNPDVVHLHSSWAGVYGRVPRLSVPVIYQPHCYKFDDPALPKLKKFAFRVAEKFLGNRTNIVLALSPHESRLAGKVSPSAKCLTLPNVPTVDHLSSARQPLSAAKRVLMVGRISPQKDPGFYIQTADIVRQAIPEAEFVWAGEGDESLSMALEAAGVTVTGWLDSSNLSQLLDTVSCYVHTATYEGFPLSILDAAARKTPIVARQIPAFEGTGLLQGEDAAAVANHVIRILSDDRAALSASVSGQDVLAEMNEDKQRQALSNAYKIATGDIR